MLARQGTVARQQQRDSQEIRGIARHRVDIAQAHERNAQAELQQAQQHEERGEQHARGEVAVQDKEPGRREQRPAPRTSPKRT
mgnify:CR=1 FL=1